MKKEIKQMLFELADEKYKNFHSGLCPGVHNIIGVRIPILRKYARELSKKYNINEILINIDSQYYEEIMLQGMLIGLENKDIKLIQKDIREFVPKIDNWAICDTFCAGLKMTKKYKKEMWQFIQQYLKSDKEFEIRFAIIMILDYYIENEYLNNDFEIFNSISSSYYYVQMAIAWAISVCLVKFYNETMDFLKTTKIDKFTYNKALQKAIESYRISDEQKDIFRSMKIK